jgi:enoyl-CoA hydratase/carnithine racemase
MDLKDLSWGDRERNDRSDAFAEVLRNIGKPVIAAVNGAAITGGLELALGCDFIIASERAFFGDTHVRVGVFPGGGMTVHLAEVIGVRRARQMSYTGELVDAREALRIGLVNEVLDHDQLLPRARELAAATAAADPALLNDLRAAYHRQGNLGIDAALDAEVDESRRRAVPTSEIAERRDSIIERGRSQVLH